MGFAINIKGKTSNGTTQRRGSRYACLPSYSSQLYFILNAFKRTSSQCNRTETGVNMKFRHRRANETRKSRQTPKRLYKQNIVLDDSVNFARLLRNTITILTCLQFFITLSHYRYVLLSEMQFKPAARDIYGLSKSYSCLLAPSIAHRGG